MTLRQAVGLAALFMLLGCQSASQHSVADAGPKAEKQHRWPECDPSVTTQKISFVHINDMHSSYQLMPDGVSPYALVRGYYQQVKKENPYTLFTSAGDEYEKGSVAEQISQGLTTRLIMTGMQFDVRVMGNHDFGWSLDEVLEESRDPWAEVLATSFKYTGSDPKGFGAKDFVAMQIGCVKVGFFGLTTWSYNDTDQGRTNEDYYPEMKWNPDFTGQAQAQIDAHRDEVDLLIAVTHLGVTADGAVALSTQGLDAILGGHSHTLLQSIDPASTGGIPITQAGSNATDVSRLDLTWDISAKKVIETTYTVTPITPNTTHIEPDFLTQQLVENVMEGYAPDSQTTVAHVKEALGDSNAVAMLAARAAVDTLHADAAIIDVGTVWSTLHAGGVSPQDFFASFKVEREPPGTPGFSSLSTVSIDGASLRALALSSREGWVVVAPETIDDGRSYLLAGQKRTLNHPETYLPHGVSIQGTPAAAMEVWKAIDTYARVRQAECLYLDGNEAIPGCISR